MAKETGVALNDIYHQLKLGLGHERVNDENVFDLINMAVRYGDTQIEALLREWQSPCSDDSEPALMPPARGFNRDNLKR